MQTKLKKIILGVFIMLMFTSIGCNNKNDITPESKDIMTSTEQSTEEPDITEFEYDENILQSKIKLDVEYQTMIGFGAGYTWYSDWALKNQKNKEEIADLLFKDAKMTILRFKNEYQYNDSKNEIKNDCRETQFYNLAQERATEYGEDVTVLMSCWSPPANLKSNKKLSGGGTLKKDKSGVFVYDKYGEWWAESVEAYMNAGVKIDYVSIQNECDYKSEWDGMDLAKFETEDMAEYGKAFLSVYDAIQKKLGSKSPLMIGPETMSFNTMDLKMYIKPIVDVKPESLSGIAFHLYVGGSSDETPPLGSTNEPDSFNSNFRNNSLDFGKKYSLWQTEFFRGTPLQTAMLINNSLVNGNLNAYIFWGGIWSGSAPQNDVINVSYAGDYWYGSIYYVMRHFSEFIRPGYIRVQVDSLNNSEYRISAFKSPSGKKLAVVLINPTEEDIEVAIPIDGFSISESVVYQTILTDDTYDKGEYYNNLGTVRDGNIITLKAKSITTVDISIE